MTAWRCARDARKHFRGAFKSSCVSVVDNAARVAQRREGSVEKELNEAIDLISGVLNESVADDNLLARDAWQTICDAVYRRPPSEQGQGGDVAMPSMKAWVCCEHCTQGLCGCPTSLGSQQCRDTAAFSFPRAIHRCTRNRGSMCTYYRPLGGGTPHECDGFNGLCDGYATPKDAHPQPSADTGRDTMILRKVKDIAHWVDTHEISAEVALDEIRDILDALSPPESGAPTTQQGGK